MATNLCERCSNCKVIRGEGLNDVIRHCDARNGKNIPSFRVVTCSDFQDKARRPDSATMTLGLVLDFDSSQDQMVILGPFGTTTVKDYLRRTSPMARLDQQNPVLQ